MGRIRTIKPEFFKHEALFDAEVETGLPLRIAFAGLWTACDKAGRFEWRPRALKSDILPYDDIDFSRVLDALTTRGFVLKYHVDGQDFGCVPTFSRHQVINNRERETEIPEPPQVTDSNTSLTREPRVNDACLTRESNYKAEGEGEREGEKKEEEDAQARDSVPDLEKNEEPKAPGLSPGFLPDLMQALGVDTGNVPSYWRADTATAHVQGWIKSHSLTEEQILVSARESRKRTPEPPDGPKALDAWMAKCATGYSAVGEIKAAPNKPKEVKPPATPEERLQFWAERINSPAYIAPTAINNTMAAALLKSGLVTKEALRSKGIAA